MKRCLLLTIALCCLAVACAPPAGSNVGGEDSFSNTAQASPTPLDLDDPLVRDAAAFAEAQGLDLEEAVRRMEFQDTIGDIQPALMAGLPETYAGLWVEHQPQYRIVIALTDGDETTIQPYINDKAWAGYVEVRPATYSLAELTAAQEEANRIAGQLNLAVTTAVDVKTNRVEVMVGNPQLFQADLEAAGLALPQSVIVVPIAVDEPLPDTNQGILLEVQADDGRTIYLPKQPPTAASMAALMEGELVEVDGCLRITDPNYEAGFLILWPHDSDVRLAEEGVEVLNGAGEVIARVGQPLRLGGGAIESAPAMAGLDELIPGLPISACPGPYWVAAPLETLAEQSVPDIYANPISSKGRLLALFFEQSRASQVDGTISGELLVDEQGCLRVGDHAIFWPPGAYLRENPLRVYDAQGTLLAQIDDTIELNGSEKGPQDYRYFANKVSCPGPYWGVGQ